LLLGRQPGGWSMLACPPASMSLCRATAPSRHDRLVPVGAHYDQNLPYGSLGWFAWPTVGAFTLGRPKPAGRFPSLSRDHDHIALGDGSNVNRESNRPVLRNHPEVAGHNSRRLNRLVGRRRAEDHRDARWLNRCRVEKRRGQLLSDPSASGSRSPRISRNVMRWTRAHNVVLAGSSQIMV